MPAIFQSGCVAAFHYVEGGEQQVIWKPDWLVDPSRACYRLGTAQLPTGPGQKSKKFPTHRHSVHEVRKMQTFNR